MNSSVYYERPSMTWYVGIRKKGEKCLFYILWKKSRLLPYYTKKHYSTLEMDTFKICVTFLDTDMLSQIWLSLVYWLLRCCSFRRNWVVFWKGQRSEPTQNVDFKVEIAKMYIKPVSSETQLVWNFFKLVFFCRS